MPAAPASDPALPPGRAGEPKWHRWQALVSIDAGRTVLRSRHGTEIGPASPEAAAGTTQPPDTTALDGEATVRDSGRLAFERLQGRLQRRGAGAARLADQWPARFVAFDLLRLTGTDTTGWPFRLRRAALEGLFTQHQLTAPSALCPSTTDADTVNEWLSWTAAGLEGWSSKGSRAGMRRRCADGARTRSTRRPRRSPARSPAR